MSFNIFKILEKDDKELIHSSFIKFLLQVEPSFGREFFGIEISDKAILSLEKSYRFGNGKNQKSRFDIEILENNRIYIIENKFKSFPNHYQLQDYEKTLNHNYHGFQHIKFLICFDKSLFAGWSDWKILDYHDLLKYLQHHSFNSMNEEERIFVRHYTEFLNEYISDYDLYSINSKEIFLNQNTNRNKFWVRLLYSKLKLQLDNYFKKNKMDVAIYVSPGNTTIPLLNIVPSHWNLKGNEVLIQVQGGDLKFYAHTSDKDFLRNIIEHTKIVMNQDLLQFKKIGIGKEKTSYIFKININKYITEENVFDLTYFEKILIQYFEKIEHKVIIPYQQDHELFMNRQS